MGDTRLSKVIELTDEKSKGKRGITFYCSSRHEYIFIQNSQNQNSNGKLHPKDNK